VILDLFAGPGGWSEGLRMLGLSEVGIEWDDAACRTAKAAGHARVRADVAALPTEPMVGKLTGLIASPPCQAWSMAGKRKGEKDRANCHVLADRMAAGDDLTDWTTWEDERSPLVCQPIRWVRELRPEWIALEEVPAVASLWEHFAIILRRWGYSVWTGDLNSADYGVPQTRLRRLLIASLVRNMQPPEPTHAQNPHADLFGEDRLPWVTWGEALGVGAGARLRHPRGAGMVARHGPHEDRQSDEPAMTVSSKVRSWTLDRRTNSKGPRGTMVPTVPVPSDRPAPTLTGQGVGSQLLLRGSNAAHASIRAADQPAPTILFARAGNDVRIYPEGRTQRGVPETAATRDPDSRLLTIPEASILQSFPVDYPWHGSRAKAGEQVGNAVPPLLAAYVLSAATGLPLPNAQEVAA
jgi:DNA (cytosine-5)-methyltransferase 1